MPEEPKKKNIFDSAIDALTNRDEKAAAEAAKKQAEAAQAEAAAAKAALEQAKASAQAEIAKAKAEADAVKAAAEKDAAAAAARASADAAILAQKEAERQQRLKEAADAEAAIKAATIKHVWTRDDTYASLAQKFYGSIKEPYWRLIYDHNKDIIGNHPNDIRVGLEIEIPPLPEELKIKK